MLKKILLVCVILIGGFCLYVASLPSDYRYENARSFAAPAEAIFPHVNDQKAWLHWSPWVKMAPNGKFTFEGPESGIGAIAHWEGKEIGKGSSTIVESVPNERVKFAMDFKEPMADSSIAEITFEPADGGTRVTWAMYGTAGFISKAFGLVMDCETMVEEKFAEGLESLEALVMAEAAAAGAATPVEDALEPADAE